MKKKMKRSRIINCFILVLLTMIVLFSGCRNKNNNNNNNDNDDNKINFLNPSDKIILKESELKTPIKCTDSEIVEKYNNKENFILYIYIVDCGHCISFSSILNTFVSEVGIEVYQVELSNLIFSTFGFNSAPTLLVIENGKIKACDVDYEEPVNTLLKLKDYLSRYVYLNIFEIELDEYDKKIEDKVSFNLYIGRDDCVTCDVFKAYVLDQGKIEKLYYFNTKKFRDASLLNDEGKEEYKKLREYLGFNWTPTIKVIKDGVVSSSLAYLDEEYYNGELVVETEIIELNKTYETYDQKRIAFINYYNQLITDLLEE